MHDTAVLVNEFGEVGLDHHLVQRLDEQTMLLGHGCVCCTVRHDLVHALTTLLDRDQRGIIAPLRRIVIETTGLADPAPLVFTVVTDPMLQHHFRIDSVVTTVDAVNGPLHLDRHPVSRKQVALADEIIITKTDLARPGTVATLRGRLRRDNPVARMTTAILGDLDPHWLLGPQASHRDCGTHNGYRVARAAPDASAPPRSAPSAWYRDTLPRLDLDATTRLDRL